MKTNSITMATIGLLLTATSIAVGSIITIDPDAWPNGTIIDNAFPGITLSAVGPESGLDGHVYAQQYTFNSTPPNVFGNNVWSSGWIGNSQDSTPVWFKVTFQYPVSFVSIDAIGNDTYDQAELRVYDSDGTLLGQDITKLLIAGEVETLMNLAGWRATGILLGASALAQTQSRLLLVAKR